MDQTVTVKDLYEYFGYRQIVGNAESLKREITVPDVNRPGLELVGYFSNNDQHRVTLIGDKEMEYIATMDEGKQLEVFNRLTDLAPMILISRDHVCPRVLMEVAYRKNFPVFTSYASTSSLAVEIVSFLEEKMAKSMSVHGELMSIYGVGVLIRADSGQGKSEIALELLKHGHILIADDRVDVARIHNKIMGECPELLKDVLEIRGIGIINVVRMFGIASTMRKAQIDLVIDLVPWAERPDENRLANEEDRIETFFGVDIKRIVLPVRSGRSMAAIIESAVMNHILLTRGIDTPKEFGDRVYNYLVDQNKNRE